MTNSRLHAERELEILEQKSSNTSRAGTGFYIIVLTTLSIILGGVGWYNFSIEVGIFIMLVLTIAILSSIRYNQ